MGIKVALALLFIQVATSSCRHHEETSKEESLENSSHDPRIAQLLSMLEDTSLESGEDTRKLVRILPVTSEEEYPRHDKSHLVKLATLRRKSKKPLAIILSTSDLKHKKFSRRIDVTKDDTKEDVAKEETKQELVEESLSKEDLIEDLSTEEVKEGLSKEELIAEKTSKEELIKYDITAEHLANERSSESSESESLTNELSKEELSLEKSEKVHQPDTTSTQEESAKDLTEENVVIEKSESTASNTEEDIAENSLSSEAKKDSDEKNEPIAENPDSYADIIELGKLLIKNQNEDESTRSAQQYDDSPSMPRYVDKNPSKSVVADIWEVEKGNRSNGQLLRTYNLSFLFNKK